MTLTFDEPVTLEYLSSDALHSHAEYLRRVSLKSLQYNGREIASRKIGANGRTPDEQPDCSAPPTVGRGIKIQTCSLLTPIVQWIDCNGIELFFKDFTRNFIVIFTLIPGMAVGTGVSWESLALNPGSLALLYK